MDVVAKDFFISYTAADKAWASWIAYILEADGFAVTIPSSLVEWGPSGVDNEVVR